MKKVLALAALVVILIIAYLKFKDRLKPGEVAGNAPAAPANPAPSGPSNPPPPAVTPKAAVVDDRLLLIDTVTLAKFNTLSADQLSDPTKTDLVIELGVGEGPVPSLRLADEVVFDAGSLPAGSDKRSHLVHLKGPGGRSVQGTTEPVSAALDEKLRKQIWRAALPVSAGPPTSDGIGNAWLWATEFRDRQASLRGSARVEGTLDNFQRGAGNAKFESVTLKELPGVKFNFAKGSSQAREAAEAEVLRKQKGIPVTLKITVDLQGSPKFLSTGVLWNMPVLEQFAFWDDVDGKGRGLRFTLALASWCRVRGLDAPANRTFAKARAKVVRDSFTSLGKPSRIIRVHLADEIQEHWVFGTMGPVIDGPASILQEGRQLVQDFFGEPGNACVVMKTSPKGETKGDVYPLNL